MAEITTYEQFELTREYIDDLRILIDNEQADRIQEQLSELHPADIAEIYEELNIDEAKYTFLLLDKEVAADVLAELEEDDRKSFSKSFHREFWPNASSRIWIRMMLPMLFQNFRKKSRSASFRTLKTKNKPKTFAICFAMTRTLPGD